MLGFQVGDFGFGDLGLAWYPSARLRAWSSARLVSSRLVALGRAPFAWDLLGLFSLILCFVNVVIVNFVKVK